MQDSVIVHYLDIARLQGLLIGEFGPHRDLAYILQRRNFIRGDWCAAFRFAADTDFRIEAAGKPPLAFAENGNAVVSDFIDRGPWPFAAQIVMEAPEQGLQVLGFRCPNMIIN